MKNQISTPKQIMFTLVVVLLTCIIQGVSYGQENGKIYWMESGKIRRANLDRTAVEDVLTKMPFVTDIALDLRHRKLYWVNASTAEIQRANLDGSNIESIVTGYNLPPEGGGMRIRCSNLKCEGTAFPDGGTPVELSHEQLNKPYSISLDADANKIYWGNWHIDIIQRANLDGSEMEDLTVEQRMILDFKQWISPLSMELDIDAGKMYWTDGKRGKIGRANLDGSEIEYIMTDMRTPYGLALDLHARQMSWTNSVTGAIQRASLNGNNVEDVVTGLRSPRDIVLDPRSDKMYWINQGAGKIQRANLDGTNVTNILTGLIFPTSIALDTSETYNVTDVAPDTNKLTTTWANVKVQ